MIWFPGKSYQSGRLTRPFPSSPFQFPDEQWSQPIGPVLAQWRRYRPHRFRNNTHLRINHMGDGSAKSPAHLSLYNHRSRLAISVSSSESRSIKSHQQRGNHQQIADQCAKQSRRQQNTKPSHTLDGGKPSTVNPKPKMMVVMVIGRPTPWMVADTASVTDVCR